MLERSERYAQGSVILDFLNADSVARTMEARMYKLVFLFVNYGIGYPYNAGIQGFKMGFAIDEWRLPNNNPSCAHMTQELMGKLCEVLCECVHYLSYRFKQWQLFVN